MKSRVKKLKGTAHQFDIRMPKDTVDRVFEQVLDDIRKEATVPGYRKGRAPMDLVKKKHAKEARDEVKRRLIPWAYQQALQEHELSPVSYPEVSEVAIDELGSLSFKAKVDIQPSLKLKKYKGIKVITSKVEVTEGEVDQAIERLQNMNAQFNDIERPLEKGDFAVCDVESFMNGKPVSRKQENMWIEVNKEASMLGLGEELKGMTKGEEKEAEATLPDTYPDENYAGKTVTFKIKVNQTKIKQLPEADDELAKKNGKQSIKELKKEIREQLRERKKNEYDTGMKNQIAEYLLKKNSFEVPGSMVERQQKVLREKAENELAQKGVDKENIESHKTELVKRTREEAVNKVRLYFILDEIASDEEIYVAEEDVENWLRRLASSYNQPFDKVREYYQKNDLLDGLKEQLKQEKTLDYLLSEANVKVK